jgi:hypothetical protein
VQFAVEDVPRELLTQTTLGADEGQLDGQAILTLYTAILSSEQTASACALAARTLAVSTRRMKCPNKTGKPCVSST